MRASYLVSGLVVAVSSSCLVTGFSTTPATGAVRTPSSARSASCSESNNNSDPIASWTVGVTMALVLLGGAAVEPAAATSKTAAQIDLNSIPPSTVELSIGDLPVVGSLLSGTYTKVDKPVDKPSVTIKSPSDKLSAIKSIASGGHLEFDVNGKLKTHLDVDVATVRPGVALIRVESPLIPALPFKNKANTAEPKVKGAKPSDWNSVTNLGTGEIMFYTNTKTGASQYDPPTQI